MNRDEIDNFLDDMKRRSAEILVDDGSHPPLAFIFPPHGSDAAPALVHLGGVMGSDEGKDAGTDMIRNVVAQTGASGVVTILEGWVTTPAPSGTRVRPSQDPLRREALILSWDFRVPGESEKVQGISFRFFHHEGERTVLGETKDWSDAENEGRFANFLG